ncbi:serine/threonine protein kinase [Nocardiopsis gilva YIM 90087]|uniref:non-specific serine/threonine protein kinase n=1 Tax=Nocardiopsis gilva YIM 90087 TaxID=1235441 RepID=A0A223S112_9ACTN|nr:Stk1 family PASTA domain-containing Ser/Thr kinase [Nocardiopsis gilva]ASU81806.1 serine/threonine protein kinase [Nocardiopsis gilva YIM 90087]
MSQPRLLGGRYELDGVIGRGGMAEVYRARDLRLDRMVAVKTLRHDMARDHTFQARFRREAQSAASLNHPSIIAVYDTGEDMVDDVSIPFIVMEYVDGRTLKELLDDDRRLLPERCAEIADGILRALEYSHRSGIVHRDIKPANVMLTRQAEVKVMDFGIARSMDDNQATMTQTSQVIGTAQYLSPEQARGERVDARSDLYSTGCVLYELLTGRPPFTGDSPVSIAYQHVREEPVPPTELDPEIPEWLEDVTLRAMAKDRDERYQSAEEMSQDIQRGIQGMPTSAAAMAAAGATTALDPVDDGRDDGYDDYDDYGYEDERRGNGKKAALWVTLALAVIAAFGVLFWVFNQPPAETAEIPDVKNMSQSEAEQALKKEGFSDITTEEENDDEVEKGDAIRTDPAAGREATPDTKITLYISKGPGSVQVPDVTGMPRSEATAELQNEGFKIGNQQNEPSSSISEGNVTRTSPEGGTSADPGSKVDLWISSGPEKVKVPDLSGMTKDQAESALKDRNLSGSFTEEESDEPEGQVIRQDPASGTEVDPNSTVNVVIAKKKPDEPTDSPSPTDGDGNGGDGNGNEDGGFPPFGDGGNGGNGGGGDQGGEDQGSPWWQYPFRSRE